MTPFTGSSLHLLKFYLTFVSIFTPIKFIDYYARSLYLQYKNIKNIINIKKTIVSIDLPTPKIENYG